MCVGVLSGLIALGVASTGVGASTSSQAPKSVAVGGLQFVVPEGWGILHHAQGGGLVSGRKCPSERSVLVVGDADEGFHCSGPTKLSVGLFSQALEEKIPHDRYTRTFTHHGIHIYTWEAPVTGSTPQGSTSGWEIIATFSGSGTQVFGTGLGTLQPAFVKQLNALLRSATRVK